MMGNLISMMGNLINLIYLPNRSVRKRYTFTMSNTGIACANTGHPYLLTVRGLVALNWVCSRHREADNNRDTMVIQHNHDDMDVNPDNSEVNPPTDALLLPDPMNDSVCDQSTLHALNLSSIHLSIFK